MDFNLFFLIILITMSEAFGQYLLRLYTLNKKNKYYWMLPFITWIFYGICTYLLIYAYNFDTMGKVEVYWDAFSAVLVPIIGILAFKEKLKLINWVGIFLVCFGTVMLSLK